MDKFVADSKMVSSFLYGIGIVTEFGRVYFNSDEVVKVLGNTNYQEVMLLRRSLTANINYHTFVIRGKENKKYKYILLCKVNEAETILVTTDFKEALKADQEYTNMVKFLDILLVRKADPPVLALCWSLRNIWIWRSYGEMPVSSWTSTRSLRGYIPIPCLSGTRNLPMNGVIPSKITGSLSMGPKGLLPILMGSW